MTNQTTIPSQQPGVQPAPAQPQQSIDWRQLDFAADGLVMRHTPASASAPKG